MQLPDSNTPTGTKIRRNVLILVAVLAVGFLTINFMKTVRIDNLAKDTEKTVSPLRHPSMS